MKIVHWFALGLTAFAVQRSGAAFAADAGGAVATIGKQAISAQELDARSAEQLKKEDESYGLQATQLRLSYQRQRESLVNKELSKLIDERVLALEAAARKTTPAALTEAAKAPAVTDKQVQDFYDANKDRITQPFAAVAGQIRDHLTKQGEDVAQRRYLDSLRAKYHAVALLEPMREQVAAAGPERGPSSAPVTLVEFSDFECPYCGKLAPVIRDALKKYPTQLRVVYRNFPLTGIHPDAQKAAEAGVCAQNQGKFWEMHDAMFDEQQSLGVAALKEKARRIGLDAAKFDECLDSGSAAESVHLDAAAGNELGLSSTPSTFVNGRLVSGAVSIEQLSAFIDDELRRDGLTARR